MVRKYAYEKDTKSSNLHTNRRYQMKDSDFRKTQKKEPSNLDFL